MALKAKFTAWLALVTGAADGSTDCAAPEEQGVREKKRDEN